MEWLVPAIVASFLGAFGWLLRAYVNSLTEHITETHKKVDELKESVDDKIDTLDRSFTNVTARLASDHNLLRDELNKQDRRVTRLESWREMLMLPDTEGRRRRTIDNIGDPE